LSPTFANPITNFNETHFYFDIDRFLNTKQLVDIVVFILRDKPTKDNLIVSLLYFNKN